MQSKRVQGKRPHQNQWGSCLSAWALGVIFWFFVFKYRRWRRGSRNLNSIADAKRSTSMNWKKNWRISRLVETRATQKSHLSDFGFCSKEIYEKVSSDLLARAKEGSMKTERLGYLESLIE
jgi:hypothetical protein